MRAFLQPVRVIRLMIRRARFSCALSLCARFLCALFLLTCLSPFCFPQSKAAFTPIDVEAAYLYKLGNFVQWPGGQEAASQPFFICILGQDEFGKRFDDLIASETIQGRKILARRLTSADAADACQIVFLGNSEDPRLAREIDVLSKKPILTVSSLPLFLEHGGMIQFTLTDNHVRFAVNLAAAQKTGLSLSSEMLKLAVRVEMNQPAEGKK
jgi:hypothetical protein